MNISYELKDERTYVSGYGQSYLANLGWNCDLVSRISKNKSPIWIRITDGAVDIIEKLGLVHLDLEFLEQDVTRMDQVMVKFNLYHWLFDTVATLDSTACLLNSHAMVVDNPRGISMNPSFIKGLSSKDAALGSMVSGQFGWMKELKDMRDAIIHREGRLVAGGGQEPCIVLDFRRVFSKNIPLHRLRIPDANKIYTSKVDAFVESVLKTVVAW